MVSNIQNAGEYGLWKAFYFDGFGGRTDIEEVTHLQMLFYFFSMAMFFQKGVSLKNGIGPCPPSENLTSH